MVVVVLRPVEEEVLLVEEDRWCYYLLGDRQSNPNDETIFPNGSAIYAFFLMYKESVFYIVHIDLFSLQQSAMSP